MFFLESPDFLLEVEILASLSQVAGDSKEFDLAHEKVTWVGDTERSLPYLT